MSDNEDIKPIMLIWPCTGVPPTHPPEGTKFTRKTHQAVERKINIKLFDPNGTVWNFNVTNKDPLYKTIFMSYVHRSGMSYDVS
jgi:hypothetical protein